MTTATQHTILSELKELDRILHRLTERVAKEHEDKKPAYEQLRMLKGILKGRLTEDPLVYQRRTRRESDAHRFPKV